MIYLFRLYWVFTALLGFSLVVASGGYSLVAVQGLLIMGLLLLQSAGSRPWA